MSYRRERGIKHDSFPRFSYFGIPADLNPLLMENLETRQDLLTKKKKPYNSNSTEGIEPQGPIYELAVVLDPDTE